MKSPAIPRSRPLLIFNPEATASSLIRVIIDSIRPCRIEGHDFDQQLEQSSVGDCYVALDYDDTTTIHDRQKGFIIGTVQEPCNDYLNAWMSGSLGHGRVYNQLSQQGMPEEYYAIDDPRNESSDGKERFRNWMTHRLVTGLVNDRMWNSYGTELEGVDCFIFAEDVHGSLLQCLTSFALQGGYVDWNVPSLQDLLQEARHQDHTKPKHNTFPIPFELTRAGECERYFDGELINMVETGPEEAIYDKFGYTGCCKKSHYESSKILSPVAVLNTRKSSKKKPQNDEWLFIMLSMLLIMVLAVAARKMIDYRNSTLPQEEKSGYETDDDWGYESDDDYSNESDDDYSNESEDSCGYESDRQGIFGSKEENKGGNETFYSDNWT